MAAIDLSSFADSFYEEATEHVATVESLLVAADIHTLDEESLNAIFRAVHSIKGGAGAFGNGALADFAHALESFLDGVRKGRQELSKASIGILLGGVDAIRNHVYALRQRSTPDTTAFDALKDELAKCAAPSAPQPPAPARLASSGYFVELALDPAEYPDRDSIDTLVAELPALGTIECVEVEHEARLEGRLTFIVRGEATLEDTRESLEFLVSGEALRKCESMGAADAGFELFETEASGAVAEDSADDGYGFFPVDAPAQSAALADADSIRINVAKMDELVNLIGELVITQAMVARGAQSSAGGDAAGLVQALAQLERNTRDLQRSILSIRMLPIRHVTCRLPRLAHDVAERLGKVVQLELVGEDTELDKGLIEKLADPLMHLVRNAIDHGIETPEARAAAGKSPGGRLTVRARHEGGKVVISVRDDGAGLDREAIVENARRAGIEVDEGAADEAIWPLIFRPGLSTAKTVTDVSGRGVGMDVVQRNVRALGGTIEIASVRGRGATFTLRLPLTLAIIEGMSIIADGESYIVPLAAIAQSVRPDACETKTMAGREVLRFNGDFIPLVSLGDMFGHASPVRRTNGVHVVLDIDGRHAAVRADALLGLHQTVVKGLEDHYRRVDGISGATILGDGRVALILDAQRVVEQAGAIERAAA